MGALFAIKYTHNVPGKAAEDNPNACVPVAHLGDQEEIPGSGPGPALITATINPMTGRSYLTVSLFQVKRKKKC